jgi:DNA-binding transcriptional regulator YiaG
MPNLAQLLKEEIRRIARSETKSQTAKLRRDVVKVKKSNVALRRIIAQLERDNDLLMSTEKRRKLPVVVAEDAKSARITAKGIRSLRRKLGLSQGDLGKLVGISTVTVGNWEKKGKGALKLKDKARAAIVALRDVGAREAKRRVEMVEEKPVTKVKKVTRKAKAKKVRKTRKGGRK